MRKNLQHVFWMIIPLLVLAGSCSTPDTSDRAYLNGERAHSANSDEVLSPENALKKHVLAKDLRKDPDLLDELSAQDIRLVLGKPTLERAEGENTAFHYQSSYCVMDVYFAKANDEQAGKYAPSYIQMRPVKPDTTPMDKIEINRGRCVESIL